MGTLAAPIHDPEVYTNPNCVKVVRDHRGRAIYFSRSPIPHVRDGRPDFATSPPRFLQHIGVYAYRREFLLQLATRPPTALEDCEKLEQLRVLHLGGAIQVGVVAQATRGVDTFEDYQRFVTAYSIRPLAPAKAA
jgi:3-deoxy-manno-octulosonate cytidylyltransferase (CMP-KDO synthetase)